MVQRIFSSSAASPRTGRRVGRELLAPALALLVLLGIAAYAMLGPTGILAWMDTRTQLADRRIDLAKLQEKRDALRNRVQLLDPGQPDDDLASEMVRRELGVAAADEVIVPLE